MATNQYDRLFEKCETYAEVTDLYELYTSPENLYEDGEISNTQAKRKYSMLTSAKKRALARIK